VAEFVIFDGVEGGEAQVHLEWLTRRGVVRIYAMSFRDGIWTLVRDAPDFTPLQFAQRFTGRFTDNGSVIHGAWETAGDGERWEHDFDLTYTKLT